MMEAKNEYASNTSLQMLKQLIEHIAKVLVDHPDKVTVTVKALLNGKPEIIITVDEQDLGKVIGKNGQTIKSIRGLVNVLKEGTQEILVDVTT